jgi:hypothetical protein
LIASYHLLPAKPDNRENTKHPALKMLWFKMSTIPAQFFSSLLFLKPDEAPVINTVFAIVVYFIYKAKVHRLAAIDEYVSTECLYFSRMIGGAGVSLLKNTISSLK